jgi:hypothetical protein
MRDLDQLLATLDTISTPDVRGEAQRRLDDPEPPMPPLGRGRGSRIATIVVAFLVFAAAAAFAWRAASTSGARPAATGSPSVVTAAPVPPVSTVYFAWPGEITEVDVSTGTKHTVNAPGLSAGDPQVYLARLGHKLAYWGSGGTHILRLDDLDGPSEDVAADSLIFVPSATPGRIWAVWKNEAASTPYHFEFDRLREIDADGTVTVDGVAHGDSWLDGAVTSGVLLETHDGLIVWDPEAAEIVARLPASSAAATYDDTVVWCDNHCPELHFTDVATGDEKVIPALPSYGVFNAWDGQFSPDGSTFAVPISSTSGAGPGRQSAVALVDVASGTVTGIVPDSATDAGCCRLSWDSTGGRLYMARYENDGAPQGWRLWYWDVGASSSVDAGIEVDESVAMVSG